MANIPFSRLYDQVLPYLPAAETPIVDSQIRKVLREFMKRTSLVREKFQFPTVPGTDSYRLTPTFGQVSSILEVRLGAEDGTKLHALPESQRIPMAAGTPTHWYTLLPHILTLHPAPASSVQIACSAVITLKQDDTTFPEELFEQHAEAIASGVLATMYGMPGKPWTQPNAAKDAGRMYASAMRTIRGELRDGGHPSRSTFRGIVRFGA